MCSLTKLDTNRDWARDQTMQPYKIRYKSWWYLQANQRSKTDAALFIEELAEIYFTPTPNAMAWKTRILALFGCADKPAEKHCWLICCERKTLFRLKKQAEKYGL
jgi:hypothetical protein